MPMNPRLLRPIASRIMAAVNYLLLRTVGGSNITTISGDRLRSIQDA